MLSSQWLHLSEFFWITNTHTYYCLTLVCRLLTDLPAVCRFIQFPSFLKMTADIQGTWCSQTTSPPSPYATLSRPMVEQSWAKLSANPPMVERSLLSWGKLCAQQTNHWARNFKRHLIDRGTALAATIGKCHGWRPFALVGFILFILRCLLDICYVWSCDDFVRR